MLEIRGLRAGYGGPPVLEGLSLHVDKGEFVAIVGPNGAGKTTLFKAISGIVRPDAGMLRFDGADLAGVEAAARPHLGIAHVPEGRQVFPSLTVRENLEMGAQTAAGKAAWKDSLEKIHAWFPLLAQRAKALAGSLSGGQQQMLAIARGLASAPRLLMLDEPSMGLAPAVADEIFERIVSIHAGGELTVLLVEQRVAEALHFASRGYVLESGRIALEGTHEELRSNDRIRQAYLGM
ncbi:MAG TPA: ABC transporter ATP-binding protein [Burkholderiales bacterium]|nr:ABC transporter ATP-binding protein [Burkholderiales bacterium]